MNSLKSLVVSVDFTPCSTSAFRETMRLARWNRAAVHAVHVIDELVANELEEALSRSEGNVREELIADARKAWATLVGGVSGASDVPLDVRIGHRVVGVLDAAREQKADLLVLGAIDTDDPDAGLSTVAAACVRKAMCDVLLVREADDVPFKSVVACVDFSPTSLRALDRAARVAAQDGAALHVLHVFDPPWQRLHYRAPTPEAAPGFQQQYCAGLERRLAAFAGELGQQIDYLKPQFRIFEYNGHRSGIIEYARSVKADLIALGTRGRTNLRDMLLGSTAEKALQESNCSVLAVKPEGFSHPLAEGTQAPSIAVRPAF